MIQSIVFHEKARPSVLSITTHHVVFSRKARPSVLSITTHHHVGFTKGTSLRAINHNSSPLFSRGARPPCYQSQLIIMLCQRARPSVLSITTHHHVVFSRKGHVLRAINHNSSSCCVFNEVSSCAINHNSSSC
jgi:hypothetical protein